MFGSSSSSIRWIASPSTRSTISRAHESATKETRVAGFDQIEELGVADDGHLEDLRQSAAKRARLQRRQKHGSIKTCSGGQ